MFLHLLSSLKSSAPSCSGSRNQRDTANGCAEGTSTSRSVCAANTIEKRKGDKLKRDISMTRLTTIERMYRIRPRSVSLVLALGWALLVTATILPSGKTSAGLFSTDGKPDSPELID